jgi:L-asparaginase II
MFAAALADDENLHGPRAYRRHHRKMKIMSSSLAPLTVEDTVELATVDRSGVIESRHLGTLAVVDASGNLIASLGNPDATTYPRSSLKPFQAIASLRSGADLSGERLALACASHVGSQRHQDLALAMLNSAGLTEADLRCPTAWPQDTATFHAMVREGRDKNHLAFNCSGKHAGFLTACVASGWDTETYLSPEHPLQRQVIDVVEEFAGEPVGTVAVDGCGAPVPQISVTGLARATSRLMTTSDEHASKVAPAMLSHPWAVHGEGAENTVVMQRLGVVSKLGAEGVLILGTASGTGLALKMLDGSSRANTLVGLSALVALGELDAAEVASVLADVVKPVLGRGEPVGAIRTTEAVTGLGRA